MDTRDVGAELQSSREARGLSIDRLAQRTRVQPRYLTAIERNDISLIPPKPFGRGFVRAYATEVGLDPEQTVREYFARFAPAVPNPNAPPAAARVRVDSPGISPWVIFTLTAGAIAVVAALTIGRASGPPPSDQAVGTSGAPTQPIEPAPSPVAGTGTTTPAADPLPAAATDARRLVVMFDVSRPCWVTATADGQRAIYALLQPGTREKLTADREIVLRAGDAGALTWSVNGKPAETFGGSGEVRTVRVTGDRVATVR